MIGYESCEDLPLFQAAVSSVNESCVVTGQKESRRKRKVADEAYEYKAKCILDALRRGPVGCRELESMEFDGSRLHRAQAVICSMRGKGHLIDTIKIDGLDCYVHRGFESRICSKPFKELYYSTKHWRMMSRARKELDEFSCVQCGSVQELETHHWRYHLFNESIEHDLVTLCGSCHRNIHDAVKGSSVHFPSTITEQEAERIQAEQ